MKRFAFKGMKYYYTSKREKKYEKVCIQRDDALSYTRNWNQKKMKKLDKKLINTTKMKSKSKRTRKKKRICL
jgi:hypothetical protein